MDVEVEHRDIEWCQKHEALNKQCCGGPKEVWGVMEVATANYREWKGGTHNVQD